MSTIFRTASFFRMSSKSRIKKMSKNWTSFESPAPGAHTHAKTLRPARGLLRIERYGVQHKYKRGTRFRPQGGGGTNVTFLQRFTSFCKHPGFSKDRRGFP